MKCHFYLQILDLLVSFAIAAARSHRREAIFGPFPYIMDRAAHHGDGLPVAALDPSKPDWKLLLSGLEHIPSVAELVSNGVQGTSQRVDDFLQRRGKGRLAYDLAIWLVGTNHALLSMLVDGPEGSHRGPLKCVGTKFQYAVRAESEEKEAAFQARVKKEGLRSFLAWHGSPAENWHGIIRNGLKVKFIIIWATNLQRIS